MKPSAQCESDIRRMVEARDLEALDDLKRRLLEEKSATNRNLRMVMSSLHKELSQNEKASRLKGEKIISGSSPKQPKEINDSNNNNQHEDDKNVKVKESDDRVDESLVAPTGDVVPSPHSTQPGDQDGVMKSENVLKEDKKIEDVQTEESIQTTQHMDGAKEEGMCENDENGKDEISRSPKRKRPESDDSKLGSKAEEPPEKRPRPQFDPQTRARSKNLFGSILGHLQRAKSQLETEKETKEAELKRETEKRVAERIVVEKQLLVKAKLDQLEAEKSELESKIEEISASLDLVESQVLILKLEGHYTSMKSFIRTQSEPTMFWLPAKHTEKTRELLAETRQQVANKLEILHGQLITAKTDS